MTMPDQAAKVPLKGGLPKFEIISKAIGPAPAGENGQRRFRMTASSTIVDRAGDEIDLAALEQAAAKFRDGVTIFMDHDYKQVEKAFGVTDSAEVIQRGYDEKTGAAIWDLDISGPVNVPNPRAVRLADSIDGGYVKLGASMTAFVTKHVKKPEGGMKIRGLDVLEASVVGIAENQRSWALRAATAIHKSLGDHVEEPDDEEEPLVDEPEITTAEATGEQPDDAGAEPAGAITEPAADEAATPGTEAVVATAEVTPDGQASAEASEPVVEAVSETPAVETPETASGETVEAIADTPITEKAYDPAEVRELVKQVGVLVEHIGKQNEVIVQKDAKITALEARVAALEGDAGSISDEVDAAKKIIEKMLTMPLRSQTAGYVEELPVGGLFAQVSPEIAEYLHKKEQMSR